MKAVFPYTVLLIIFVRQAVQKGFLGHRLMERGIKIRDLRFLGQQFFGRLDAGERGRIMEGGEFHEFRGHRRRHPAAGVGQPARRRG